MSQPTPGEAASLTSRQYRWLDRATKLLGVGLIALGLHVGGSTALGLALAALGVLAGLSTILIDHP